LVDVIEDEGDVTLSRSLDNRYFVTVNGGPLQSILFDSVQVQDGNHGMWRPIAAERLSNGTQNAVLWLDASADQFRVWNTDSNWNYINDAIGATAISSDSAVSYEVAFGVDINGDGSIGTPPDLEPDPETIIESEGSVTLLRSADNRYSAAVNGGDTQPILRDSVQIQDGNHGIWRPIAAERINNDTQNAVLWLNTSTNNFTVWFVNSNWEYTSGTGATAISSDSAVSYEAAFGVDINGDGSVAAPPAVKSASSDVSDVMTGSSSVNARMALADDLTGVPWRMEAEDMNNLSNYGIESWAVASGGALRRVGGIVNGSTGTADFTFDGVSGIYDVIIGAVDESGGKPAASLELLRGGASVAFHLLDQDPGGAAVTSDAFVAPLVASDVVVNQGDLFTIVGTISGLEAARIDYIEFVPVSI
jgi:hypothetical protein